MVLYKTFADINECSEDSDNCHHHCSNTDGSFVCSCNPGFTLASDGKTCNGITNLAIQFNLFPLHTYFYRL